MRLETISGRTIEYAKETIAISFTQQFTQTKKETEQLLIPVDKEESSLSD